MVFDYKHAPDAGDDLSATEAVLAQLIAEYRAANGLPAIPLSRSLSIVGNRHAEDILYNLGGVQPSAPGTHAAHSWSDAPYDAANPATYPAIWEAPQRVGTAYPGYGYEILFSYLAPHTATVQATPTEALNGWKASSGHNAVILNLAPWDASYLTWGAVGIGMLHGVAGVWFGHEADPAGAPDVRLQGAYGEYNVTVSVGAVTVIDSLAGRDPGFTIPNADKLKFSDGTYTVATQSFAATGVALPVASLSADQTVSEAVVRIHFTVTLDIAPAAPVSLRWNLVEGTATVADRDLPAGQGGQTLTFTPGGPLAQVFTVLVNDEAHKLEASETFGVTLDQPSGLVLGRAAAGVTLLDNHIAPPAVPLLMTNTTTGTSTAPMLAAYAGPLSYLAEELIYLGSDSISVNCAAPNVFLRSGSGDDALVVGGGQNVLDAGTGSNFLTGGSGADTFFLDARGAAAAIWSSIVGLNAGDAVTLWGVTPAEYAIDWFEDQGAPGYTGLTMHATAAGRPTVSLTLAGLTEADRSGGRLALLFGTDPGSGSDYMFVFANA